MTWIPIEEFKFSETETRPIIVTGFNGGASSGDRWLCWATYFPDSQTWYDTLSWENLYPPTHFMIVSFP